MAKHIHSDPADFNKLSEFVKPYEAAGRTESAALLIWFLETIFRLDETEAQDAVCDRKHDVGIDAVAVRDDENEVVLFQARRKQKLPATLGDVDFKEFVGSLQQFQSGESVKKIISSTSNDELRNLLTKHEIAEKIGSGYTIRPIFVCNITNNKGTNPRQAMVLQAVRDQIEYVVTELNYFLDEHGGDTYDYKTEFKSPKAVGSIRNEVLRAYTKDRKMKRVKPFALSK
jgi:hypothetical protein